MIGLMIGLGGLVTIGLIIALRRPRIRIIRVENGLFITWGH